MYANDAQKIQNTQMVGAQEVRMPEIASRQKSLSQALDRLEEMTDNFLSRLQPVVLAPQAPEPATGINEAKSPPYSTGLGESLWAYESRVRSLLLRMENAHRRLEI